ncbi:prephenate dehydrogenase [Caldicellulosiruptor naganoensis]|uniref:Prephenate dehydrogenase/arogenate dehydrogenase family protein n=1 Tax=Caldicellulosiruptor naganoensis TaxID=29324 RepID=A0ABY7BDY3_9FIRM|nr:prephenate dehydrogenase/arogenate dehydrogenase family protein [Caldicellulosiruptor naganoensis]WAM31039.1 prephenate dehydrogenase/arogenate dehydrogenase family protein [Caldicellulosiruptor naganoensis]
MRRKILIVGLGLIGGSLAKVFNRCGFEIHAFDINHKSVEIAIKDGIVKEKIEDLEDVEDEYAFSFICVPVLESIEILEKLSSKIKKGIITDVGSTKAQICRFALQKGISNFIGGHPMAGTEKIGYENSFDTLFKGAYYFITPIDINSKNEVEKLKELITSIGCRVEEIDYNLHDAVTGVISHLPHIVSAGLVNMLNENSIFCKFAGGGFKDITRISSSSPKMWADISFSNKEVLLKLINKYIELLTNFKSNLESNSYSDVYSYFERAKSIRDKIVSDEIK